MIISDQSGLDKLYAGLRGLPYVTIDTEFLRDKTYYPKLCLIQMAGPDTPPAAIDPLVDLDLSPVFDLLADEKVTKVFHAARQDIEIFYNLTGEVPKALFDTQVAAMVCGFGDQIGYNSLVQEVCKKHIDKGAQFTDWSRRPLSSKQLTYALDDVTYLRDVYRYLVKELGDRAEWVVEEVAELTSPGTYQNPPEEAWRRIKLRTDKPKVLAVLREIAAWREREAQKRDVPRNRVLRDETLADIAVHTPETAEELAQIRGVGADNARGRWGRELLEGIKKGLNMPKDQCPHVQRKERFPPDRQPALEIVKMLLRVQAARHGVAAKLIATGEDLEALVLGEKDISVLRGWRHDVFGKEAQALLDGKLSMRLRDGEVAFEGL
ncbi:MAG: ribonuclease D [Proteobacteria bacterium]|nr:ribonuclease D [Pseudomonadota bacterium]